MRCSSLALLIAIAAAGCYEPPYRTDIRGNGQGGADIKMIPKDPEPPVASAPPKQVDETAQQTILRQQGEIDRLKALVSERDDEISRLIRTPTTQKASDHGSSN